MGLMECVRQWSELFSTDTQNDLASLGDGYQNITVARQPAQPSLDFLKYLTDQIQPGDTPGDCILPLVIIRFIICKGLWY